MLSCFLIILIAFLFLLLNFGAFTGAHAVIKEQDDSTARALDILSFSLAVNLVIFIALIVAVVFEFKYRHTLEKEFAAIKQTVSKNLSSALSFKSLDNWLLILTFLSILLIVVLIVLNIVAINYFSKQNVTEATKYVNIGFYLTVALLAFFIAVLVLMWFFNRQYNKVQTVINASPELKAATQVAEIKSQAQQQPQPSLTLETAQATAGVSPITVVSVPTSALPPKVLQSLGR